jgi:hypothetical protein
MLSPRHLAKDQATLLASTKWAQLNYRRLNTMALSHKGQHKLAGLYQKLIPQGWQEA